MPQRTRHNGARQPRSSQPRASGAGEAGEGPASRGTLASGYSSRSATGGTGGDVLQQRGSGYSPGADSRVGSRPEEADALAREGVAAGAAGFRDDTATGRLKPGASGDEEEQIGTDGGAAVTGVSGVSGGGRGTTSANNTRK